jgi:hypothetical protein
MAWSVYYSTHRTTKALAFCSVELKLEGVPGMLLEWISAVNGIDPISQHW